MLCAISGCVCVVQLSELGLVGLTSSLTVSVVAICRSAAQEGYNNNTSPPAYNQPACLPQAMPFLQPHYV